MEYLLQVIKLSCEINGKRLAQPLDFSLRAGEALQIQGSNGVGKTTLLKALIGLHRNYTGKIDRNTDFSYIAHQNLLHPDLTVRQNLQFLQAEHADFEYFGVKHLLERRTRELSVGQQQRASLSRLLSSNAKLWLLDEPLVNLDQIGRQKLFALCQKHLTTGGSLIMVTHDSLEFGTKICMH